jgi:hypothetical protein
LPHVAVIAAAVHRGHSWPPGQASPPGASRHGPPFSAFSAHHVVGRPFSLGLFSAHHVVGRPFSLGLFSAHHVVGRPFSLGLFSAHHVVRRLFSLGLFSAYHVVGLPFSLGRSPLTHSASGQIFLGLPDFSRACLILFNSRLAQLSSCRSYLAWLVCSLACLCPTDLLHKLSGLASLIFGWSCPALLLQKLSGLANLLFGWSCPAPLR